MLIIYNSDTKEIKTFSGYRQEVSKNKIDDIKVQSLKDNEKEFRVYDFAKIKEVFNAKNAGAEIKLIFDDNDEIEDIEVAEIAELECPSEAEIETNIEIKVSAGEEEGEEVKLFIDDEEQETKEMPCTFEVEFETESTYKIEVDAGKHGKASKEVVVE